MSEYNTKNYTAQGGERIVIGGTLEFTDDAEVVNMPEVELPIASKSRFGLIKIGDGLEMSDGVLSGLIIYRCPEQAELYCNGKDGVHPEDY